MPTSTPTADRIAAIVLLLFAAFVILQARALPYWTANAPGPGFVPFWLGVLLACAAAVMLARSTTHGDRTDADVSVPDRGTMSRVAAIVGLTSGAAALAPVIGLVLASGVFMAATLAYLRPEHPRANWVAALVTPLVTWLLFVRWLGVPLPPGPFGF